MSQQGDRHRHEDDWWGELYRRDTDDVGPAAEADSVDDRFDSASRTVGGPPPPPGAPPASAPAAGAPWGPRPPDGPGEPGEPDGSAAPGPGGPARTGEPFAWFSGRKEPGPGGDPGGGPTAGPDGGPAEGSAAGPPAGPTTGADAAEQPPEARPPQARPSEEQPPQAQPPESQPPEAQPPRAWPREAQPPQARASQAWSSEEQPPEAGPSQAQPPRAWPSEAQPSRAQPSEAQPPRAWPPQAQPPRPQPSEAQPPQPRPPEAQPPRPRPPEAQPPRPRPPEAQPPRPQPPEAQPSQAQPPRPQPPRAWPPETLPLQARPPEAQPPRPRPPEAQPPRPQPPEAQPSQVQPPQAQSPEARPPESRPPEARPAEARPAEVRPPEARPPAYGDEPVELPPAEPYDVADLVPDTVLDGARCGAATLRAVSSRGESARRSGEPRRDAVLLARFGGGPGALVLVALASGAGAAEGAQRAARELCEWIGGAVGRSHARLVDDIRAGNRGALKSGLHRLTDRGLGRLRARAAELGVDPAEYTAAPRCLLLPADPACRIRVFFGAGDGGVFRLRAGAWQDLEPAGPAQEDTVGGPVVGYGGAVWPAADAAGAPATRSFGIATPGTGTDPAPAPGTGPAHPSPAPVPAAAPFRFRASVARPGDVLLLCGGGLAEPLRGRPELAGHLAERWARGEPPGLAAFLADTRTRVNGYADDRTAAAVWEA